ncbi:hypothetical protein [Ornithinimicrobium tianjinense]|uniref:Uncharacterized protein n=1 Tax=Ornithinimicrobium tianjinense TaxID=1195761 RepID=A0A917BRI2_9MICO|nr:hypothetical protein [Ornithinimicrobium tianjinense]GGF53332.1 hypothetical protein GCM10011366_21370 [Ornithinimicrobium tianjinense]
MRGTTATVITGMTFALTVTGCGSVTSEGSTTDVAALTTAAPAPADQEATTTEAPSVSSSSTPTDEPTDPATAAPEPTQPPEPAQPAYPDNAADYVDVFFHAVSTGSFATIDAMAGRESAAVARCLAGNDGWIRWHVLMGEDETFGSLEPIGYPDLMITHVTSDHVTRPDYTEAYIVLDRSALGGPDAVVNLDVSWSLGSVTLSDDCFASPVAEALDLMVEGDASALDAMLSDDGDWSLLDREWMTVADNEVRGFGSMAAYQNIPADLFITFDSTLRREAGDMEPRPVIFVDPAVLERTTQGSIKSIGRPIIERWA